MHITPIQKLSFLLLVFTNTQVYATNVRSVHDKDIRRMSMEKNINTLYDQEREIKKEKLRQSLLERMDYSNKKEERNKSRKQVQRIVHIKRVGKQEISEQEQELLDTDKKLGKEIQNIEQSVAQEVAIKYPYSGQKGHEYDTTRTSKEELEAERKRNKEELEAERKRNKEELEAERKRNKEGLDARRKRNKKELDAEATEAEHKHEIWIKNKDIEAKEEEIKEKEFFKKEKAKRRKAEEEFFNRLQAQEESHNSNSNSNPQEKGWKNTFESLCHTSSFTLGYVVGFASGKLVQAKNKFSSPESNKDESNNNQGKKTSQEKPTPKGKGK